MKHFRFSIIFTIICLAISAYWGFTHGPEAGLMAMFKVLAITSILAVMEVSLSFDNAVVNASVLKHWNQFWRTLFLTRDYRCRVWYAISLPFTYCWCHCGHEYD